MDLPSDPTDYKGLLSFMMHELRRIREVLEQNATQLSVAVKGDRPDLERLRTYSHRVVEEIYVLHNWLSIADFYLDPDQFAREPRQRISLFKLFDKARVNLSRRSKARTIIVELLGAGGFYIEAHPIVAIVPYLLLDNALKYAPGSSRVTVEFAEVGSLNVIRVSSVGPRVFPDELSHLVEPGFRGRGAARASSSGYGQGLALLSAICKYNDAKLNIASGAESYSLNGIEYSDFTVELHFPRA